MPLVRYFAGARSAAGISEEPVAAVSLDEVITAVSRRHGDRLVAVLAASSFLVDGLTCHDRQAPLSDTATVDVLPPFAGG